MSIADSFERMISKSRPPLSLSGDEMFDLNKKETTVSLVIAVGAMTFLTFAVIYFGITTIAGMI